MTKNDITRAEATAVAAYLARLTAEPLAAIVGERDAHSARADIAQALDEPFPGEPDFLPSGGTRSAKMGRAIAARALRAIRTFDAAAFAEAVAPAPSAGAIRLIGRSVSHGEIATAPYSEDLHRDLILVSDWMEVSGEGVRHYWGRTADGSEWRVHLHTLAMVD